MSNPSLGRLFHLSYVSPSLVKEYVSCPRAFLFRKVHHLGLIPTMETNQNIFAQERVDTFTFSFFSTLKTQWNEKTLPNKRSDINYLLNSNFLTYMGVYTRTEDQIYREQDEKVFTLLSWLVQYLWEKLTPNNRQLSYFLPIMVNQFIQAPNLNLQGRPSAVFLHPNDSALILIQTYQSKSPEKEGLVSLQALIYARILEDMRIKTKDFLHVNYRAMNLRFQKITPSDFKKLENFLKNLQTAIEEENFDPPNTPPCGICEFKLICND